MRLGVMFDRGLAPETLIPFCRHLDELAVEDVWVVEDLGWTGAISSAATALAVTERLRVGIGIAPAPLRNPALLAMELGNLARVHPHRLAAGIGHGVQDWMRQVGALAPSPLALLEETITAVRGLLRGETVTLQGRAVHLDGVGLVHPPADPPTVLAGVMRPRSLELSARVAQGTILPEGTGPDRVEEVRELVGGDDHELVLLTHLYVGEDASVGAALAADSAAFLGIPPQDVTQAVGSPSAAADAVRSLWEAGADTVVVRPFGPDPLPQVELLLAELR
ncbi:alkanesulfonate monooxygenase SsuD/methylene tetrahydromethanopterin reductase-like flavin-dependent oxidoreductase (luciferase family) [Streptosporangium becharense]|uniref:Alkanesulfonate monooxygenase SsuD/methylene tetrahydromethanopterin reductase-like flavin-dependent oxidoreductase (Luciferase family) n=1 Tax=Streptosporangium becharense TaxID=1816182 RepID=A0A7W9ID46_9ACTN|nr:LLM class flavin-dependent oxidoreductase [Streptosporangium becharense]MBB2911935.1 alkanesulfonate monooxygenase SsuD/methylene tetrahydromethanopterin reductase-like flavin-dependent oxidoreductase (luciferase family) [Streptosporangium becharense]MBB5818482.1 alkanesulfonate monooxygenase SsuD/methylene tetrahydromethanopterin reductase-like flavin-dependent oxidoreductase (luciferase family) [Streptosporangium becharense]